MTSNCSYISPFNLLLVIPFINLNAYTSQNKYLFLTILHIDFVSVCETATEPPNEEPGHINSPQRLALEATFINTNLSQQMLLMVSDT